MRTPKKNDAAGPSLILQFAGQARVSTTAAGPGLKSHLRTGPGPKCQASANARRCHITFNKKY